MLARIFFADDGGPVTRRRTSTVSTAAIHGAIYDARTHALGEIDDDGLSRAARSYRFICRCGKAGTWQPSKTLAKGQHAVHRSVAEACA
jgi:hypothetical protein